MKLDIPLKLSLFVLAAPLLLPAGLLAADVAVGPLLAKVRAVGPKGAGHVEAIAAMRELSQADARQLPEILVGMDGADELPTNWLRAAAETVAQRTLRDGGKLPLDALEVYLLDTRHSPRGRRLAYELIAGVDASAERRLVPRFLNDPSLELRRDTVAMALDKAAAAKDKGQAADVYRTALLAARDPDQIKTASAALRDLGQAVDLPSHFGFVMRWHLIGPFDNTDTKGFDVAYPPEKEFDTDGRYEGKSGTVAWRDYTTSDEYGVVDLNQALANHKGAIAYAYSEFLAAKDQDAQLRLSCINGNKIWLNGELLTANHVYHAGMEIDQYIGRGRLAHGKNTILVKVCQNEQTESWAQQWRFQLRVCDQYGTAILSQDRPK